jgi:amidase
MSGFAEYDQYDALGLAALVRSGAVTPVELLEEAIARAERLNPVLNAVVTPMYDEARRALATAPMDGTFAGVPILLKDLLHAYAGVPMATGSAALRHFVPREDSVVVNRLRRAGAIAFGKTNVPEFGLVATTEPAAFGATRNPWDTTRSAGGSSGGSGAAVAAGITPLGTATDGGGSIRIPAAWCGLFGLKPTRGRVSSGPYYGTVWDDAVVHGVLTRSVRDTAAALDVLAGAEPGDPYPSPPPERSFLSQLDRAPGALRIGICLDSPIGRSVHPDCRRAAEETATLLESMGHSVEEVPYPVDGRKVASCYILMAAGHIAAELRAVGRQFGIRAARAGIEPATRLVGMIGEAMSAAEFVESRNVWNEFGRAMAAFHQRYDLLLTPSTAVPPVPLRSLLPSVLETTAIRVVNALRAGRLVRATGMIERLALDNMEPVPFTQLANLTGQPAISVPTHRSPDGLPHGVQLIGRVGEDALLLRLAARLEEARPYAPPPAR